MDMRETCCHKVGSTRFLVHWICEGELGLGCKWDDYLGACPPRSSPRNGKNESTCKQEESKIQSSVWALFNLRCLLDIEVKVLNRNLDKGM